MATFSATLSPGTAIPAFKSSLDDDLVPWDFSEVFLEALSVNPVVSRSHSEIHIHGHADSNSNSNCDSNSNSDGTNRADPLTDQRKRRRMISNRESARRSRVRKQKHLEDLTDEVNRLKTENTQLSNRLLSVLHHCHRMMADNEQLHLEHSVLEEKLQNMRQLVLLQHLQLRTSPALPCSNEPPTANARQGPLPSLIV